MAKCILHVGMHKTGSTSIQNSLKDLDDSSFYYARLLGRPNHSVIMTAMFARHDDPKLDKRRYAKGPRDIRDEVVEARRDLASSIKAADGRTLVISGEGMLRMSDDELVRLKSYLERHGYDDIKVMAYIRSPIGYISSAVQTKLKGGSTGVFNLQTSVPDYRQKLEKFDTVFGRENVSLFKFDPAQFPAKDVVQDFCIRAGIPLTSIKAVRRNESITLLAAKLRFQHATLAKQEGLELFRASAGAALSDRLLPFSPTRFRLAPSLIRPLLETLADDIAWMEQRLGASLKEDLKDEPEDVHGPEDLLKPIPGINEKLRALLEEDGLTVPPESAENTVRLVHLVALSSKQRKDEAEGKPDRTKRDPSRKLRALAKKQRRAARQRGEGADRDRDRRRARRALRESQGRIGAHARRKALASETGLHAATVAMRPFALSSESISPQRVEAPTPVPSSESVPVPMAKLAEAVASDTVALTKVPALPEKKASKSKEKAAPKATPAAGANSDSEAKLMRQARNLVRKAGKGRLVAVTPLTSGPMPLLSKDKKLVVLWSPKSACTTTYVWFAKLCGFSDEVKTYASWPHKHRQEVYNKSEMYVESANSGMADARVLRIIRDPYSRAVSIYRHALQTHFANEDMEKFSGGRISAETGYSFQTFLDLLEQLDMQRVDMHFRPQVHPYERVRKPDVVINISKTDLFTNLNAFEESSGYPKTRFEELNWLHNLESKRKAKQEPMEGDALDRTSFSRHQVSKLGQFPSYAQLLTPEAKKRIEAIYKVDFDAYKDFL